MGLWTGDKYGQYIKTPNDRATETYMENANKLTLQDGIRYYRKINGIYAYFAIVFFLIGSIYFLGFFALDKGYDRLDAFNDRQKEGYDNSLDKIGFQMCQIVHDDGYTGFEKQKDNSIIFYCTVNIIGIP